MTTQPRGVPGAVLRPNVARLRIDLSCHHPREALRPFVDYLWIVGWRVETSYPQQVLTQPKVHICAEEGRILVYGVGRRLFHRILVGEGRVIGVAFRAGGFRPFLGPSDRVGSLQNKVIGAGQLWSIDDRAIAGCILAAADEDEMVRLVEDLLESRRPRRRERARRRERVHAGLEVGWADFAGELGYRDQAHLVRDFTAAVGTPPGAYARSVSGESVGS